MLPDQLAKFPLDHLAIAVESLEAAGPTYAALGFSLDGPEVLEREKIRAQMAAKGNFRIELLEPHPTGAGPIGSFLSKRGPGMHHMALRVENMEQALKTAQQAGLEILPGYPAEGLHGTQVAFLDPKSTGRVLIELVYGTQPK